MNFDKLKVNTPINVILESESSFIKNYKMYDDLLNRRIHEVFKEAVRDEDFLKISIFNNDYLNISPVETFLSYYASRLPKLTARKIEFINALFENLFKSVLGNPIYKEVNKYNLNLNNRTQFTS